MNDTSNNTIVELAELVTQEVYESYVYNLVHFSVLTLLFYVILLRFSQEREHIWLKKFSFPSLLYLFTRYGSLVNQGFNLGLNFLSLGKTCDIIIDVANAAELITTIGVQVLLIARAYALCEGNKFIITALALSYIFTFILSIFGEIRFNGCTTNLITEDSTISLTIDVLFIITELIVFAVCMWKVWGIWKLKREVGTWQGNDLVSILLQQSILRCCFVVIITLTQVILIKILSPPIVNIITAFQDVLSVILVAGFTLDLRERNAARIEAANIALPTLQIQSVLQHIHQSFLVEIGTPEPQAEPEELSEESEPADVVRDEEPRHTDI